MTTRDMNRNSSARSKFSVKSSRSTSIIDQDLLYAQMSHHYRRLMNAKSNVDSSQPRSFRPQERPRRSHRMVFADSSQDSLLDEPTPSEMALVDKIVNDDKHRPDVIYRDHLAGTKNHYHGYTTVPPRHDCTVPRMLSNRPKQTPRAQISSKQRTVNKPARVPPDLIDRHYADFESADEYKPRILKSAAQSRVRDLKVYHPPRRKPKSDKTTDFHWDIQEELQQQAEVEDDIAEEADKWLQQEPQQTHIEHPIPLCAQCQCDIALEQRSSKVSIGSRDSAYNGGVSSGGESRGPTPEQNNLAILSANTTSRCEDCSNRSSGLECPEIYNRPDIDKRSPKDGPPSHSPRRAERYETDAGTSRLSARSPPRHIEKNFKRVSVLSPPDTEQRVQLHQRPIAYSHLGDNVRYAAFTQAITADILSHEVLSDRGINLLFQRHMEENIGILDMALMQKEIETLRTELDIKENDDINAYPLFNLSDDTSTVCSADSSIVPSLFSLTTKSDLKCIKGDNSNISCNSSSIAAYSTDLSMNRQSLSIITLDELSGTSNTKSGTVPSTPEHIPIRRNIIQSQLLQAAVFTDNSEMATVLYQNELEALPIERKLCPCRPNSIALKEYLNLDTCSSPKSARKEDSTLASNEMLTNSGSPTITTEEIVGNFTDARKQIKSIDSNSLKLAIQEIIESILLGNISDVSRIVDEPVVIEDDNTALANKITASIEMPSRFEMLSPISSHSEMPSPVEIPSPISSHSEMPSPVEIPSPIPSYNEMPSPIPSANVISSPNKVPSPIENPKIATYVPLNNKGESFPEDTLVKRSGNVSYGLNKNRNIANEDSKFPVDYADSDFQTGALCCFRAQKKKKTMDETNKMSEVENYNKEPMANASIRNQAVKETPDLSDSTLREELSWQEMEKSSNKINNKRRPSSSSSSKSSSEGIASKRDQTPRVRKVSDPATRRRSTYLSISSSSSATNNVAVKKNPKISKSQARRESGK